MNPNKFLHSLHERYLLVISVLSFFVILLYVIVITIHPLDLTAGSKDVTWISIIRSVENGKDFRACDESYFPNCAITNQISAMREPLPILVYAVLSKLTGDSFYTLQFVQLMFSLLTLWGIFLLGNELGNRLLGLAAALIWTFYLPVVRVEIHVNGDLLAGACITFGLLLFLRCSKYGQFSDWMGLGLMFGLAALSRSASLIITLCLLGGCGLLWLAKSKLVLVRFKDLVAAVLVLCFTVSPWVIRNMIVFGEPIIGTTLVGYNLFRHNAIVVGEVFPHYVGPEEAVRELGFLIERHPELNTPINEAQVDRIYRREAIKMILAYPEEYIELVLYRFVPLWFNIGVLEQYGKGMTFLDYLVVVQQAVILMAFLFSLLKGGWRPRYIALSLGLFIFSHMLVAGQLRYLVPIMPAVISISTMSFLYLWPKYFSPPVFEPSLEKH
jgi:4-amino-4-deoxy-L-arabinose transferase-like glycosyltransferase